MASSQALYTSPSPHLDTDESQGFSMPPNAGGMPQSANSVDVDPLVSILRRTLNCFQESVHAG